MYKKEGFASRPGLEISAMDGVPARLPLPRTKKRKDQDNPGLSARMYRYFGSVVHHQITPWSGRGPRLGY
jgi:hypothetical protein